MTSLLRQVMGAAFDDLPPALQRFHGPSPLRIWRGSAEVEHGSPATRPAVWLGGFPRRSGLVPFRMTIHANAEAEVWHRDFDGHCVTSTLRPAGDGLIAETLGAFTLFLRPRIVDGALHMMIETARIGPLPLPLYPRGGGIETAHGDGLQFDVDSRLPILGRIIRYRGHLSEV